MSSARSSRKRRITSRRFPGLAASLVATKRNEEAVTLLHQASELEPADPELPMRMAEIHMLSGDGENARSEMARALQIAGEGNSRIALRAGRLLSSLKEYAEAAERPGKSARTESFLRSAADQPRKCAAPIRDARPGL